MRGLRSDRHGTHKGDYREQKQGETPNSHFDGGADEELLLKAIFSHHLLKKPDVLSVALFFQILFRNKP